MPKLSDTKAPKKGAETSVEQPSVDETLADRLKMIIGSESVASFARRSGVGESLLRKYLSGALPNSNNLVLLADAGGCYVDWLACGRPPIMRAAPATGAELTDGASGAEDEFLLLKRYRAATDEERSAVQALLDAIANPSGGAWYRAGQAITSIANIFPRKK